MGVSKLNNRLTKISNVKFAKGLFKAHKTNTPLDGLFSIDGGVPKATNWMVVGDPGVGKSTVTLDIIANAKKSGSKVLFISAEMSPVDLKLYVDRYPKFGDLDIFFPQEIDDDESPKAILEEVLNEGYDIVLIDSFIELQATIQESDRMTRNRAEKWLLDLIRFVDTLTQDERYVVFSKNRRGHVGKQMFFNLAATGDVTYDTERFKKSESLKQLKKKEKELVKKDGLEFDKLFRLKDEVTEKIKKGNC